MPGRTALHWLATYQAHLGSGVEVLAAGGVLTPDFAQRCQELDDAARKLGGAALREAAGTAAGRVLMDNLAETSAEFEGLMKEGLDRLQTQRGATQRNRQGLHGYATTGQWLKSGGARYIERTG